ncbi:hypothetical protein AcW2_000332 [Taiwanofungus camphoratus]|nr:hypothetical protein AcW2_000332 [Antrodia cinnamomea]
MFILGITHDMMSNSQDSLTSCAAMQLLCDVEKNELKLWKELKKELGNTDYISNEDIDLFAGANGLEEDDEAIPEEIVHTHIQSGSGSLPKGFIQKEDGSIALYLKLESLDYNNEAAGELVTADDDEGVAGVAGPSTKRRKLAAI